MFDRGTECFNDFYETGSQVGVRFILRLLGSWVGMRISASHFGERRCSP